MTENQQAALKRLRRKVENMHLDLRGQNNARYLDTAEMLKLIEIMEKDA
jgi:hypothetical protein